MPLSYIDLLDAIKLVPGLVDKRLVDGDARREYTPVHGVELVERLLERRLQALLLGDVGLDVQRPRPKARAQRAKLVDRLGLYVLDGDVAAHLADGRRQCKADALCAARDDVRATGELEPWTDIADCGRRHGRTQGQDAGGR